MKANSSKASTKLPAAAAGFVFAPEQFKQFASVAEAFFYNATANPHAIAYDGAQRDSDDGSGRRCYRSTTHAECAARVLKIASFLVSHGVRPGDRLAVLSFDRPEWTEAEMAVYAVGGCVVPAYVRDTPERLGYILRDACVSWAFVENQQQLDKILQLSAAGDAPRMRQIVSFEKVASPHQAASVHWVHEIFDAESAVRPADSFGWTRTQRDDLACIYYTSGSSGLPKGVPATHGQILANLYQIAAAELVDYEKLRETGAQPNVTFVLPERAHAYPARSAQLVFTSPAKARFPAVVDPACSDINHAFRQSLRRDLREGGAGMIPIVPKIAIAIEQRVRQRLACVGIAERLAHFVVDNDVAKTLRNVRGESHIFGDALHFLLSPLRRRVADRIRREIVGPDFEYFISGGAKLPLETAAFLFAIGMPIYEGYGSTETNCPIASNTPRQHRLGTVGKPLAEVEIRVDRATGELLVRGPNVVSGYWNRADETSAAWDAEGWYHTRDVASLAADGFLKVEGRLDNMMVLLNGENVSPVAIENSCAAIAGVESVVVIGDHRPALVALFALDGKFVQQWAADQGHCLASPWQRDPKLLAWLRGEVERQVNQRAGRPYECIRHVAIIEAPSIQQQTLTATEKLRRKEIEKRYAGLIDELFADSEHWLTPAERVSLPTRRVAAL